MKPLFLLPALIALSFVQPTVAATTRIGNGDEGSDLEGFSALQNGPIVKAREEAVALLKSLNIPGIHGLGTLLPEVESSKLYITKKDSTAVQASDQNQFHADMKGRVYARTFPESHAATRFFPVAEKLDQDQLIALHIHEGLHRSLPEKIREDESIVSEITLAITSPGANFDGIQKTVKKYIPDEVPVSKTAMDMSEVTQAVPMPETARAKNPSLFAYEYKSFRQSTDTTSTFVVNSMHVIETELYPFSLGDDPVGLGIGFSLVNRPAKSFMGPLDLSAKVRAWTVRGFDIGLWADASLNMLSNEELKDSQFGRDNYELGISIKRDLNFFSVENYLSYMIPSSSDQKIGNVNYRYDYGGVFNVSTHPAAVIGGFRLGGFLEIMLGDHYKVTGTDGFVNDPGRYRLISAGPEIQYRLNNVVFSLAGRFLIDSTEDASLDSVGDLMGVGTAQGNISGKISIFF